MKGGRYGNDFENGGENCKDQEKAGERPVYGSERLKIDGEGQGIDGESQGMNGE